jgi:hypothetical protein
MLSRKTERVNCPMGSSSGAVNEGVKEGRLRFEQNQASVDGA